MSTPSAIIMQDACQVLRARVRYRRASMRLPGTPFPDDDTAVIREATRLYVESWIVPIIDAIEAGDTDALRMMTERELCEPMDTTP